MPKNGFIHVGLLTAFLLLVLFVSVFFLGRLSNVNSNPQNNSLTQVPFVLFKGPATKVMVTPSPTPAVRMNLVSLKGEITCNSTRANILALSCAIGLLGEDGKNYGLISKDNNQALLLKFKTGDKVLVTGEYNAYDGEEYNISGNIDIESIVASGE